MYGIYANIWGILMVNVTIYSIHGSYGYLKSSWVPHISPSLASLQPILPGVPSRWHSRALELGSRARSAAARLRKAWRMRMDQDGYGSIPIDTFLVGWTSIYQLSWGSLGTRVLTHPQKCGFSLSRCGFPWNIMDPSLKKKKVQPWRCSAPESWKGCKFFEVRQKWNVEMHIIHHHHHHHHRHRRRRRRRHRHRHRHHHPSWR